MKFGMCGVGGMGREMVRLFYLHPEVEALYIADADPAARAATAEVADVDAEFSSLDELLETDVDSVGIFTPPWTHAELSCTALRSGRNVFCACPIGFTPDELQSVIDAVVESGRIYMTAETSYYRPATVWARNAWREGRFGEYVYAEGEYYYRPLAYMGWIRDYYGNMPPTLYPTHSTAIVIGATGRRFARVTAVGMTDLHEVIVPLRRLPQWKENHVANMSVLAEMVGGGACRINEMRNVGCKGELGSIFGTLGSMRAHEDRVVWTNGLYDQDAEDIDLTELWRDPAHHPHTLPASKLPASFAGEGMGHDGSHRFLVDEFVRAVLTDSRPHNHVWAAAAYMAPGIAAWESLKADSAWVDVPDPGEPSDRRAPLPW